MRDDRMHGVFTGLVAMALAAAAYGQQSTPPPATDFAPAAPGATSASPTTDIAAPAADVTSGAGAARGALDDRPNEQSAAAASPGSTTSASDGAFPPPTAPPASPLDQQLGSGVAAGGSTNGAGAGQRGELGVWMVESGGPGVRLQRITAGSAADQAGLRAGDVILGINGRGASSPHGVAQMIRQFPLGQPMTVQFWRDGQTSELQVVLQPAREQYEVAFRGDESIGGASRSGGDLETRVMRLEQQLAMVLQELRQLRQSQPGSGQATIGGAGVGETTAFGATTETTGTATETTGAATTQSGAAGAAATTQPDPFGEATTPADAQPAATPPTTPAPGTEPAASDDAFGTSTTESPTDASTEAAPADAAPAEGEAAPAETPAGTESDDLFE